MIYKKGHTYDADDPKKSLQIMLNITNPLEREIFFKNFWEACEDGRRCLNLHGLTREEIYQVSDKKIIK